MGGCIVVDSHSIIFLCCTLTLLQPGPPAPLFNTTVHCQINHMDNDEVIFCNMNDIFEIFFCVVSDSSLLSVIL